MKFKKEMKKEMKFFTILSLITCIDSIADIEPVIQSINKRFDLWEMP